MIAPKNMKTPIAVYPGVFKPYNDPHLLNIVRMPQSHDQIVRER